MQNKHLHISEIKVQSVCYLGKFTNLPSGIQPRGILNKTFCKPLVSCCENKKSGCGGSISVLSTRNCVVEAHFSAVAVRNHSGAAQFPLWPRENHSGAAQIPVWTNEIAQGRVIFRCEHEIFRCVVEGHFSLWAQKIASGRVKSRCGG